MKTWIKCPYGRESWATKSISCLSRNSWLITQGASGMTSSTHLQTKNIFQVLDHITHKFCHCVINTHYTHAYGVYKSWLLSTTLHIWKTKIIRKYYNVKREKKWERASILAMAKRFITFRLCHDSFAFELVSGFIITTTDEQIGVREPEISIRTHKKTCISMAQINFTS